MKLEQRRGASPATMPRSPHMQLDQQPTDTQIRRELARRIFSLPGVEEQPTRISVPGARALCLRPDLPGGPAEAFMVGREFAHLHPEHDSSLHMMLPPELAAEAIQAGWAEFHPAVREGRRPPVQVMIYAPRDWDELETVYELVCASRDFARGATRFTSIEDVKSAVGTSLGSSDWHETTQEQVDLFAEATGDHQWIHVDPHRAASGPFGRPIAHGYLILALAPTLLKEIVHFENRTMGVNYGCNKVRFIHPVHIGHRVRLSAALTGAEDIEGGVQVAMDLTFEIEGIDKPACVAQVLYRWLW